jgi:hypothetical protein
MIGGEKYGRIGDEAEIVFYYALKCHELYTVDESVTRSV